jgi:hypothetical protein
VLPITALHIQQPQVSQLQVELEVERLHTRLNLVEPLEHVRFQIQAHQQL